MNAMITHRIKQGTQEWLDLRAQFNTASEASAMMGCCAYLTRTQLLDQKKSGITPEPTYYEKQLFALGHKAEDMARPIVESIIDDDLFQLVASRDNLLASFDGITLMGDVGFEHKIWNEKLAECVRNNQVPESHVWQLEQQLYVSGAEKILFVVSDGTPEKMVHCWYESDPVKRKQLLSGWDKFNEDLKTHIVGQEKVQGKSIDQLMQLSIQVQGTVLASNLDLYTENAVAIIEGISTELVTDQDFADAEKAVKWCKSSETSLTDVKANVLSQSTDINAVLTAIDEIQDKLRSKRLVLEKLVKSQKDQIKQNAIHEAQAAIAAYLSEQKYQVNVTYSLENAIKGKKSLSSMNEAIFMEVSRAKGAIDVLIEQIDTGIAFIDKNAKGYEFLFSDKEKLAEQNTGEYLVEAVKYRIDCYNQQQAEKAQAAAEESQVSEAARLEAERMIAQAKKQKEKDAKAKQKGSDNAESLIAAADLDNQLRFNHGQLATHLGHIVKDSYTQDEAAQMIKDMAAYLNTLHAELTA